MDGSSPHITTLFSASPLRSELARDISPYQDCALGQLPVQEDSKGVGREGRRAKDRMAARDADPQGKENRWGTMGAGQLGSREGKARTQQEEWYGKGTVGRGPCDCMILNYATFP